ncbi:MAG: PilC/PilY family type IV pilus protein [Pseudomonadota bacterium]
MQAQTEFLSTHRSAGTARRHLGRKVMVHGLALSMLVSPILSTPAYATLADSPLYLTSAVEPNIMFVLDDSGSMQWEGMPDDITTFTYLYPRPSGLYGSTDYGNWIPDFDGANIYNRRMRSPHINKVYYNPAVTYSPWVDQNGTSRGNATTPCARYNPELTLSPNCLILTANQTVNLSGSDWWFGSGGWYQGNHTFYPATYYRYDGGDVWTTGSYTEVKIIDTTASYTGEGRTARSDCTAGTCTYAQEIQNFANWFTYYRSRVLAARAGIGKAFAAQGTTMRVGFGAINKGSTTVDGVSTSTIIRGVRSFSGTDRTAFFNSLYGHPIPAAGTPLRRALDDAGQYFSRTDNPGPWGNTPGTDDGVATNSQVQCRQSYTILMTDGYWNGSQASTVNAQANVDGTGGPTHTGPGSASFTYSAVSPFTDSHSNTLADVAMYYWKNDLRGDLDNSVPVSTINPAFWQHMSTFGVGLGVTGSVSPTDAFNAITSGAAVTWPAPTASNAAKLDDLLHASVNGRGGFFSAGDPATFASELSSVLNTITSRISSAAAVASNSTRLTSSTHLYQALFNSGDWSGNLKAFPLLSNGTVGAEIWDAANGIPAHGSRNIKTWNGTAGMDFSGAVGNLSANEVNYLRGDGTNEIRNSTGPLDPVRVYRNRSSVLGDIVNADPHFAHNENFGYNTLTGTGDPGLNYTTFLAGKSSRTAVVYAAANDGMLHAFRASDGAELFAYVPKAGWEGATPKLRQLTQPNYSHKYFVDGSPTTWDAWWSSSWKTVLTGGLGAGGKGVYALDVSNPDSFGNGNVLWEFTGGTTPNDMGHVMGPVTVARFYDGNFWAVFGNGYQSTSGKSVLFMVRIDSPSTVKAIVLDSGTGNGLSAPILIDRNGDRIIDLIYAGDLKGNLWKVDVTASNTNSWQSYYRQGTTPKPLFIARDGNGVAQPITAIPEVGTAHSPASGLMVYVGTGRYQQVGDNATTTVQTMYGVLDNGTNHELLRGNLQSQSIIYEGTVSGNRVRAVSNNTVNYGTQHGWYMDLLTPPSPGTARGERVISPARLFGGKLIFQSIVPSLSPCDYGGASWLMQVNPRTGGEPASAAYDVNNDGLFNTGDRINVGGAMVNVSGLDSGVGLSGGFGVPISAGDRAYVPLSGTTGILGTAGIASGQIKPRASWRQIQ